MPTIDGVTLDHRLHSGYARTRLAEAFHEVSLDALHPWSFEMTSQADRDWLRGTIRDVIPVATEVALSALADDLERLLRNAPPELVRRLEERPRRRDLGLE